MTVTEINELVHKSLTLADQEPAESFMIDGEFKFVEVMLERGYTLGELEDLDLADFCPAHDIAVPYGSCPGCLAWALGKSEQSSL